MTGGGDGLELVRILEAASLSLKADGAPIKFSQSRHAVPSIPAEPKKIMYAAV